MSALRTRLFAASAVALAAMLTGWGAFVACLPTPASGFIDSKDIPEGGLLVNPQVVTCGTTVNGCDQTADLECCSGPGAPKGGSCFDAGTPCPPETGLVACNESADCAHGQLCCAALFAGDGGYISSQCAATCPAPGMQLCRTNGECTDGKCVVQTCSDGFNYEMCGLSTSPAFPCGPGARSDD